MWVSAPASSAASPALLRVAGLRLVETNNNANSRNNNNNGYSSILTIGNRTTTTANNSNNTSSKGKSIVRGAICAANALLLTAAFVIVSAFFADTHKRQHQQALLPVASYTIAPATAGCLAWLGSACVASSRDTDVEDDDASAYRYWRALTGTVALDERRATGLFSEMNPLVICLVVQAITTALDLGHQLGASLQTRWLLQRMGLAVLLFFACLLLFMQSRWRIPQNNLLWLEGMLALAFGVLGIGHRLEYNTDDIGGSRSSHPQPQPQPQQHDYDAKFAPAITTPMLGVAVLALAGQDDASALVLTYASLCGVSLLWLLERHMLQQQQRLAAAAAVAANNNAHAADDYDARAEQTVRVLRLSMWLCLTPFIIRASAQFYDMGQLPSAVRPQWVIAALALTLVWFVWDVLIFVVAYEAEEEKAEEQQQQRTPLQLALNAGFIGMHYALYATVMLLVLLGLFLE